MCPNPASDSRHCGGSDIAVVSEAEDNVADATQQKDQDDSEHRALTEGLRDVNGKQENEKEIDQWNQHKKQPPAWPARNLEQYIDVVDRNDASPSGLTAFLKHFPHSDGANHEDCQAHNQRDAAERECSRAGNCACGVVIQKQCSHHCQQKRPPMDWVLTALSQVAGSIHPGSGVIAVVFGVLNPGSD